MLVANTSSPRVPQPITEDIAQQKFHSVSAFAASWVGGPAGAILFLGAFAYILPSTFLYRSPVCCVAHRSCLSHPIYTCVSLCDNFSHHAHVTIAKPSLWFFSQGVRNHDPWQAIKRRYHYPANTFFHCAAILTRRKIDPTLCEASCCRHQSIQLIRVGEKFGRPCLR